MRVEHADGDLPSAISSVMLGKDKGAAAGFFPAPSSLLDHRYLVKVWMEELFGVCWRLSRAPIAIQSSRVIHSHLEK
jgi:hypothetical protein